MITIALSKGRIFDETLPLLAAAGIRPSEDPESSRKLIISTDRADVRLVIVRASDVPTYVQYGAADLGVAGKDVLIEHGGDGLYQPVDLAIARCRMMVAVPEAIASTAMNWACMSVANPGKGAVRTLTGRGRSVMERRSQSPPASMRAPVARSFSSVASSVTLATPRSRTSPPAAAAAHRKVPASMRSAMTA